MQAVAITRLLVFCVLNLAYIHLYNTPLFVGKQFILCFFAFKKEINRRIANVLRGENEDTGH